MRKEHESWAADRKTWERVLNAASRGNMEPMQRLLQAYIGGEVQLDAPAGSTEADAAAETAGQQYILNNIIPETYRIAAEYGADPKEVTQAVLQMIQNEPVEFLTQAKIETILQHEIQNALEVAGYSRNGQAAAAAPASTGNDVLLKKLEAMEQELLSLKAGKANSATQAVRDRTRRSPPAGGGSVSSAGDAVPAMKSREDMKKWLRGETE
jgi:cell division septum initiation protein DivIVA